LINDEAQWLGDLNFEDFFQLSNHVKLTNKARTDKITKQPRLEEVFQQLTNSNQLKSGSLVYIISDFVDLEASQSKLLMQLQTHCFAQALHIIDPSEKDITASTKRHKQGEVCFQDIKSDSKITLKQDNVVSAQNTIDLHFKNIKQTILKSAVRYSEVMTNEENLHEQVFLPLGQ